MDLDVAQVRAFVAAAEHGNLTRAAEQLFVTQQALSKRIARLESAVGRLFDREPSGLVLTDRGLRFLPAARELLATAEAAVASVQGDRLSPLRVDVWGHLHPVHALVRSFALERPEVTVELSMRRNFPLALAAVVRRELDVAAGNVANLPGSLPEGLSTELVTGTQLAALVNDRSELAARELLGPDDLRRCGLWWPRQASSPELNAFVEEYARSLAAPLVAEGSNLGIDTAVDAVRADKDTVTLVGSDWPIPTDVGLRVVPIIPTPWFPWYLVWPTRAPHALVPALRASVRSAGMVPSRDDSVWLPAATACASTPPQPQRPGRTARPRRSSGS